MDLNVVRVVKYRVSCLEGGDHSPSEETNKVKWVLSHIKLSIDLALEISNPQSFDQVSNWRIC